MSDAMRAGSPALMSFNVRSARALPIAALCGALALTACADLDKRPVQAEVTVPSAYPGAAQGTAPAAAEAAADWRVLYKDPHLAALIAEALDSNRDVRIALARVQEARAQVGPAEYAQLPQVSIGGDASRQQLPQRGQIVFAPGQDRRLSLYGASVNASYEADVWGRVSSLTEAARAEFLASRYAAETVRIGLIAEVASAYFDILALREEVAMTRDSILTREKFLDLTRKRQEGGRASQAEVARAESALAQARTRQPQLELALAQSVHRLALLVGRQGGEPSALVPAAASLPEAPEVPAGLPSRLLERRPDLLAAGQELLSASSRVRAQRAALLPSLSLTGALGTQSRDLGDLFTGPSGRWSFGLGLLAPIIDAQRNRYAVEAQEAREVQAALRYEKAVQSAFREVSDALVARTMQARVREAAQAQIASHARLADIALKRYEAGMASYFEVVDAQAELLNARIARAEAQRALLGAGVQLYRALGGGWDPASVRAAASEGSGGVGR